MSSELHTPKAKSFVSGMNDIMSAYNTQSKIQLYDDSSAMSNNEITGVSGRDIPLEALRPNQPNPDPSNPSSSSNPSRYAKDRAAYKDIRNAYGKMTGESTDDENGIPTLKSIVGDYIESDPEDDESFISVLETLIRNTRGNLEMLEALYRAISPKS